MKIFCFELFVFSGANTGFFPGVGRIRRFRKKSGLRSICGVKVVKNNNKYLTMEVHSATYICGQEQKNNFSSKYRPEQENPDPDIIFYAKKSSLIYIYKE